MLGHHVTPNVNTVFQRAEDYRRIRTERVDDRVHIEIGTEVALLHRKIDIHPNASLGAGGNLTQLGTSA
jgi:hypothetical protein